MARSEIGCGSASAEVAKATACESQSPILSDIGKSKVSGYCATTAGAISTTTSMTSAVKIATGRDSDADRNSPNAQRNATTHNISHVARSVFIPKESAVNMRPKHIVALIVLTAVGTACFVLFIVFYPNIKEFLQSLFR